MQALPADLAALVDALPARMCGVVDPWAQQTPDAIALREQGRALSYAALREQIARSADWLAGRGVRPGDRVLLLGENSIALAVLVLAAGRMNAWPLVVNARISAREVDGVRAHSGARLVVVTGPGTAEGRAHAGRMAAAEVDAAGLGPLAVTPADTQALAEPVQADGARQVGALIYTSGTTGAPKGVMLSHRSVMYTAAIGNHLRGFDGRDRIYGVLPMSHIVGLSSVLVGGLMFGACVDLVPRFDAAAALAAIGDGVTRVLGVPTMYQRLLDAAGGRPVHAPALRGLSVAGAPLDASLKAAVEQAFGLPLQNGYGITECAPTIAATRADAPRTDTAVGPPLPGVEVRLVAPGVAPAREVAEGEVGELHVRGPNVMLGYYRQPALTAEVIDAEGWFNTGDLARREGEVLHVVGRTKELIIRSGFNVYPPEVEAVLASHPAVAACAVVGRRVPGNEEVVAFVQLRPGAAADAQALADHAAPRLAPYKRPSRIVIAPELPATASGKILKHVLAEQAAAG